MFSRFKKIISRKTEKNQSDVEVNQRDVEVNQRDVEVNQREVEVNQSEVEINQSEVEVNQSEINKKNTETKKGDKMVERNNNNMNIIGGENIIEIGVPSKIITIEDETSTTDVVETTSNWWDNLRSNFSTAKRPTKTEDNATLNIVFFKQDFLNKIMEKCLPKAGESEFQFHYRALQLKIINPETNARVVFTVPTVFFNFKQEVSGASVDYDLRKVSEISNQLKPVSQQMAKVFVKQLSSVINYFKEKGFEIKFVEEEVGSIHRHPGRFGFSATDLDDNPLSPGVIYRNKKAVDLVQTDSVLYCGFDAELYTTETRIFNINPVDENDEDKGVEGTVATAPTLCYILQDQQIAKTDLFASFFNELTQENETKWLIHNYKDAKEYKEIKKLFEDFIKNYTPADAVNPKNIQSRISSYERYYGFLYKGNKKNSGSIEDAKKLISGELKFFEPIQEQDIEFAKEYLKDPETIITLKEVYERHKNKKNKLVVDYKGGAQVRMTTEGGQLSYKGKVVWSWYWPQQDMISYEDIYRGI